jgi:hypothetical protein
MSVLALFCSIHSIHEERIVEIKTVDNLLFVCNELRQNGGKYSLLTSSPKMKKKCTFFLVFHSAQLTNCRRVS